MNKPDHLDIVFELTKEWSCEDSLAWITSEDLDLYRIIAEDRRQRSMRHSIDVYLNRKE